MNAVTPIQPAGWATNPHTCEALLEMILHALNARDAVLVYSRPGEGDPEGTVRVLLAATPMPIEAVASFLDTALTAIENGPDEEDDGVP